MSKEQDILDLLDKIEQDLRHRNMWGGDAQKPSLKALASTQPFCLDTLDFHQWLEYVLIVKMKAIIEDKADLPHKVSIYPIAIEYYRGQWAEFRSLIELLKRFDDLFK